MKQFKLGIWIVLLLFFQIVVLPVSSIDGIIPGLLFTFSVCCTVFERKLSFYVGIPAVCGLITDICSGKGFGTATIVYLVICFLIVMVGKIITKETFLFCVIATLISSILCESAFFLVNLQTIDTPFRVAFWSVIIKIAAWNTIIAVAMYPLLHRTVYSKRNHRRKRRKIR